MAGAFTAQGLTRAQGLADLAAQGLAGAAQGLDGLTAQGLEGLRAQGFAMAQGFATVEVAPKVLAANWSDGDNKPMAKSQGRSEKSAPLSQFGPGSQE